MTEKILIMQHIDSDLIELTLTNENIDSVELNQNGEWEPVKSPDDKITLIIDNVSAYGRCSDVAVLNFSQALKLRDVLNEMIEDTGWKSP